MHTLGVDLDKLYGNGDSTDARWGEILELAAKRLGLIVADLLIWPTVELVKIVVECAGENLPPMIIRSAIDKYLADKK